LVGGVVGGFWGLGGGVVVEAGCLGGCLGWGRADGM